MSFKGSGQVRRSQVITTWGPGALLDLPRDAVIVGGLATWPRLSDLEEISEPRLSRRLQAVTQVSAPRLFAPPADTNDPRRTLGIGVWRFPEWFLVQETGKGKGNDRSRRLVHRTALDEKRRYDGSSVVPTRFVRACPRGHVDDLDWYAFVHGVEDPCRRQLWLDERGTSGDLRDLVARCECGEKRGLYEAAEIEAKPLGTCRGARPWLGKYAREQCRLPSRLLIRTAANAYFPQVMSALSLPVRGTAIRAAIADVWDDLQVVESETELAVFKRKPQVQQALAPFTDGEVVTAIRARREGSVVERPVKLVELDSMIAAPEGYGDDVPVDPDFHARRLPERAWRHTDVTEGIEAVVQLHRLREVIALIGFTRFEAERADINGEFETDVERADLAEEPVWFPAVENRGEGIFIQFRSDTVQSWLERPSVIERLRELSDGHDEWLERRKKKWSFPGGPYILLHTLSHLLIGSVSMRCGYPASSIRERIYADADGRRYGLLLYTASPDAEGTLGGLVSQARYIEDHLAEALLRGGLCSNDPICAQHTPGEGFEGRWLHGASCHGCALVSETSCEMRNDYLDRALVVPTVVTPGAAFFKRLT